MLSKERKELLDRLVEEGKTLNDLQKKYRFNFKTIRKHHPTYRAGRTNSTRVKESLEKNRELVEQLREERAPGTVIAEAIGVSHTTLKKHRPDLIWSKQEAAEFAAMVSKMTRIKGV